MIAKPLTETDHDRAPDFEGLIQRVGQRFIDGEGTVITIAEFLNCGPKMRWSGRKPDGTDRIYDDAGKNLSGDELPQWNLVGPAPGAEEREQLKKDNARLIAENKALKRQLAGSAFSEEEVAKMIRDAEDGFIEDDYRDCVQEIVEGIYRIDHRADDEGFGRTLDQELIVAFQVPREFTFSAQCGVVSSRDADCREREFQATRLEIGEPNVVLYSLRAK